MQDEGVRRAALGAGRSGPWTLSGGPDPDYADGDREIHHAALTDPALVAHFRRRFPGHGHADYDAMIRLLEYVWDCPQDGTANVTGYRCSGCGRTRAGLLL